MTKANDKQNTRPKLLIFASGGKDKNEGGSGFKKLVEASIEGNLDAEIVAVISNHANGGVHTKAQELNIPFEHFGGPRTGAEYEKLLDKYGAEWVSLSGWINKAKMRRLDLLGLILRKIGLNRGLIPNKTINIHPGPLPLTAGTYGHRTHEKVIAEYRKGVELETFAGLTHSEVTMHFVTKNYDEGPVFFRRKIRIIPGWEAEDLKDAVNAEEHKWQWKITNDVIHGKICWDGIHKASLRGYIEVPAEEDSKIENRLEKQEK